MRKLFVLVAVAVIVISLASCASKKPLSSTVAYTPHPTECIGSDPSGLVRLRVWGEGKDRDDACENAKKKAVEEVLFSNITAGPAKGNSWPLIDNPSIRRTHSDYFAKFFKKGGAYKKYIKAEKPEKDNNFTGNDKVVVPVEITVDKENLRQRLIKDKIFE